MWNGCSLRCRRVLSDFLQQLFTLVFTIGVVVVVGGKMAWVLLLFVPVVISSARRIGSEGTADDAQGAGQAGGDSEHPARDDYGQPNREGVRHGAVGDEPLSQGGAAAVPRESEVGEACRRSVRR